MEFSNEIFSFVIYRPPPKTSRRIGPIAESPLVTETPPSPSSTFNTHFQSSCSDSRNAKADGVDSRNANPASSNTQQNKTADSNVKPSEFLRNKHNDEKLSSVILKYTQQSNINKSAQNSSSESLINSTNNEETLHADSFSISERVCQLFLSRFSVD